MLVSILSANSLAILRRCTNVASALQRTSNVVCSWSHGSISKALSQSCKRDYYRLGIYLTYRFKIVTPDSGHFFPLKL